MPARVYDGSDTGRENLCDHVGDRKGSDEAHEDTQTASALSGIRRWPVVISYFNEAGDRRPAGIHAFVRSL